MAAQSGSEYTQTAAVVKVDAECTGQISVNRKFIIPGNIHILRRSRRAVSADGWSAGKLQRTVAVINTHSGIIIDASAGNAHSAAAHTHPGSVAGDRAAAEAEGSAGNDHAGFAVADGAAGNGKTAGIVHSDTDTVCTGAADGTAGDGRTAAVNFDACVSTGDSAAGKGQRSGFLSDSRVIIAGAADGSAGDGQAAGILNSVIYFIADGSAGNGQCAGVDNFAAVGKVDLTAIRRSDRNVIS